MKNIFYIIVMMIVFSNVINSQSVGDTIEVSTGWNLIGGLTTGYIPSILSTEPPGIITGSIFGYTPGAGYYQADSLKRGKGYWVKVSQNGVIIFLTTPLTPILVSPANGTINVSLPPTLVWYISSGATSYAIQVSTDDQFTNLVYNQSGLNGTSQEINGLFNSTIYYWRVNATNSYGTSSWSSVWTFWTEESANNNIENGDFEQGNVSFTTEYIFSPGNISNSQTYDIVTDPSQSLPSAVSYGDHTSGSGFMMAVNGATNTDVVVWSQTVSVNSNTLYNLSLWISSMTVGNQAHLDFRYNDVSVSNVFAPTSAGIWENFSTSWNSGEQTLVTLKIIDLNNAYGGNDFALDDISFTANGSTK